METFGERLRKLREDREWTQAELAAKIGTRKATISKLENGTQEPRWHQVLSLVSAFQVTLSQFMGEADVGHLRYMTWLRVERSKLSEQLRGAAETLDSLTA